MSAQDEPQGNVERVLQLMQATFGDDFKTYYDGDPEVIPKFNLPCLIVTQTSDNTAEGETGSDDVKDELRVKVVFDKSDDWMGSIDPVNMTEKKIRQIIAGRDAAGLYLKKSVKGALRVAMLDGVEAVAPLIAIQYGINPRETMGSEANAVLTAEGWATFSLEYSVDTYR